MPERKATLVGWVRSSRRRSITTAVLASAIVVAVIVVAVESNSRDEGSYVYGRGQVADNARMAWESYTVVGNRNGGNYSRFDTPAAVCRESTNTMLSEDSPRARSMRKMDADDLIAGCTEVLADEVRNGDVAPRLYGAQAQPGTSVAASPTSSVLVADPTTSAIAPTSTAQLDPTARTIDAARIGDCLRTTFGPQLQDGSRSVVVEERICGSSDATDVVTAVEQSLESHCPGDWVRTGTTVSPPKVLCLRKTE